MAGMVSKENAVHDTRVGPASRGMLINGLWGAAETGETIAVENPARREPIGTVPRARKADVERAVA
ncbi:hypothetical protein ACSTLG_00240, partial [Vibrio parahaemolyticus]